MDHDIHEHFGDFTEQFAFLLIFPKEFIASP